MDGGLDNRRIRPDETANTTHDGWNALLGEETAAMMDVRFAQRSLLSEPPCLMSQG
jgi:hypothetical protein